MTAPVSLDELRAVMARLRDPEKGCPWDVKQNFASIAPYTVEEAYEVMEAIVREDRAALCDELGDLLLQVLFHARMAEEEGSFALDDVLAALHDKLIRRHPHVFGEAQARDEAAVKLAWEAQKAREREGKAAAPVGALHDVAQALPALLRGGKLIRRAERAGLPLPAACDMAEWARQSVSLLACDDLPAQEAEMALGGALQSLLLLARRQGLEAESVLRDANRAFEARYAAYERGEPMTAQALWSGCAARE
ncbi:MAG: nucleoside triphosphate pyrophosphohydrolase [Halothiobacillaceae bacterium]|nr:nucleoside triphosphate pyrophosphohydrolase [Halothiobacillaceae bacterium]